MSIAIAKNHMAEMNMLGMLAVLDQTLADATRDKISYSEFADILLQAEADYRQERKTVNRIKAAKFTVRPAFEDLTSPRNARSPRPKSKKSTPSDGSMMHDRCCSSVKPASARPSSPRRSACTHVQAENRCST